MRDVFRKLVAGLVCTLCLIFLPPAQALLLVGPTNDLSGTGSIASPGDMQSWLFTANPAGGTVTIVSTPTDPSFQLTDLLIDPNGNTIGAATGAAPGDIVDLLNVPLSLVGTYTIIVGGFNNTTGGYQLHVTGSTDASIHSLLPEPSSWILVLSALTMLAFLLRQRSGSMVRRPRARA